MFNYNELISSIKRTLQLIKIKKKNSASKPANLHTNTNTYAIMGITSLNLITHTHNNLSHLHALIEFINFN